MISHKMFCSMPNGKSQSLQRVTTNTKHKRTKKYSKQRFRKDNTKTNLITSGAMSTWAENFTVAATWQLKHQLAYWKARAVSLQYENNILHDVIRRNHIAEPSTSRENAEENDDIDENTTDNTIYDRVEEIEDSQSEYETDNNETDSDSDDNKAGEDFEVSEEFIQFLTANAKYKEDAKRERELLKAKLQQEESAREEMEPKESSEQKIERSKELYGDKWQRIIALESNLMASFIKESDKLKPMYWPNIPFNFNS